MKVNKLGPTPTWQTYSTEWYAGSYYQYLRPESNEIITLGEVSKDASGNYDALYYRDSVYYSISGILFSKFNAVCFTGDSAALSAAKEFIEELHNKEVESN